MFEVPSSKAGEPENRFEFKIGDDVFEVPTLAYIDGSVVEMIADSEQRGGLYEDVSHYALFGPAGSPAGDAVRTLEREQMNALLTAYYEASGIKTGESAASTDS